MLRTLVIFAALCWTTTSVYAGDSGVIKICHQPGIQELHESDEITLPAGTQFADVGPIKNADYGMNRPVSYSTTKDAILSKGVKCVDVPARVIRNLGHSTVGASQRRLLGPSFVSSQPCPGRVCPWSGGITLQATVVSGFDE